MNKSRLLTSIAALALVLGLGACNEQTEDNNPNETPSTSTSTSGTGNNEPLDYGDPVADIFNAIQEYNNYTLTIQYYEVFSDDYQSPSAIGSPDDAYAYYREYWVKITYTPDAALIEYYTSYSDYQYGRRTDLELFVNDYQNGNVNLYELIYDDYIYLNTIYSNPNGTHTWQSFLWSLLDLVPYSSYFVLEDTINGDLGPEVDYSFDLSNSTFKDYLVEGMFRAGNRYGYYNVDGPTAVKSIITDPSGIECVSKYFVDYGEWDVVLDTGTQLWSDSETGTYWIEDDIMQASVTRVGTSSITDDFIVATTESDLE